jgi:5-methylcytosine-specific restriction endonuclease McrA
MLEKICIRCGFQKPANKFPKYKSGNYAKKCHSCKHEKYYSCPETKERKKQLSKAYREKRKVDGIAKDYNRKVRKAQRARYIAAGLTANGTIRKIKLEKIEKIKTKKNEFRQWHKLWLKHSAPEPCVMAWYKGTGKPWNNPRFNEGDKFRVRYNCDNVFRAREILKTQARKKARAKRIEAQSDGTLTEQSLGILFADAKFCAYCMEPFENSKGKTLDHVYPLYLGGKHSLDNAVIACVSCNSSKGKKSLVSWLIAARPTSNSNA